MSVTFLSVTVLSPLPSAIFLSFSPLVTLSLSPQPFCHLLLRHLLSHSQSSSCHLPLSHLSITFPSAILPVTLPSATFLSPSPQPSFCHLLLTHLPVMFPSAIFLPPSPHPSSCHVPLHHPLPCSFSQLPTSHIPVTSSQAPCHTPFPVTSLSPSSWLPTSSQLPACHLPSSHPVPHSCTKGMAGSVAQLSTCLISMSYLRWIGFL
jgi:hypothetical protein